jgi:hypothetical protein
MCGPLFLTVASFGLLSVGACLGFLTAALFAAGAEPADLPKSKNPSGAMADASRALHRVADRFPELLHSLLNTSATPPRRNRGRRHLR